jgi:proline dehydrogenase
MNLLWKLAQSRIIIETRIFNKRLSAMAQNPALSFDNTEIAFRSMSDTELLRAYTLFRMIGIQPLVKVGPRMVSAAMAWGLPVTGLIKHTIFKHFCGGESIEGSREMVERLARYNVRTVLDYAKEAGRTDREFEAAAREVMKTIVAAAGNDRMPFTVFKVSALASHRVLEMASSGLPSSDDLASAGPESPSVKKLKADYGKVHERIVRICSLAAERNVRVMIDAEETWIQGAIDCIAEEMMARFNRDGRTIVFNTVQLYRVGRLPVMQDLLERARRGGFKIGLKLVRGAYMEKERAHAAKLGQPSPIQPDKASSDAQFDAAAKWCLDHISEVSLFAGTHNEGSCLAIVQNMHATGVAKDDPRVWFSQLLGMSDHLSFNLAAAGFNVAKYVPYGPVKAALPYLFRRAEENTSVSGQAGRELTLLAKELRRRGLRVRRAPKVSG